jgi:prepilin-type N-terminal cleavage/methylation domain-containing protein/prepilin-type processing-associated H-X9-DG protein
VFTQAGFVGEQGGSAMSRYDTGFRGRAFTIIELLVVVSIVALLVSLFAPAITQARDQASVATSRSNLRTLATAHATYAADWNDRQFTLIVDSISDWGSSAVDAFTKYNMSLGDGVDGKPLSHAAIKVGWGYLDPPDGQYGFWQYPMNSSHAGNYILPQPIVFNDKYFGAFRFWNCSQFNQYVSGRFYDPVFYARKDTVVWQTVAPAWEDPGDFSFAPIIESMELAGDVPAWPSYCMSPAAMFNPQVMSHDDPADDTANGWRDPWSFGAGFRSPALSQAAYPSLKTQMIEHNWLQNVRSSCNPAFLPGTYEGCEPYYFNHAIESRPNTLFYDGHVGAVEVREAMAADSRMRAQTRQPDWGLWSMDTYFGADGYMIDRGYDQAVTSFHILTTDGIRGRDVNRVE